MGTGACCVGCMNVAVGSADDVERELGGCAAGWADTNICKTKR